MRTDIQIMRAVAVLAVVVSHFWPAALPSGFAGVDMFFVISGFLITSLIVSEIRSTGSINLFAFWMRRLRRIFPAALTVIVATTLTVHLIGLPTQLRVFAKHAIASLFSTINLVLGWESVDYSSRSNATSPLQHYWSLAVEEQFYVVWPLVLVGLVVVTSRLRRSFDRVAFVAAVAVVVASFGYAVVSDVTGTGNYFDSVARAWELGIGAALALGVKRLPQFSLPVIRIIRVVAWITLCVSFVAPGLEKFIPGAGALPAVLVSAILLALPPMEKRDTARRFRPWLGVLTWVGDRSFSLYLWHWPALILTPYLLDRPLTLVDSLGVILFVVVASDVSYRFVENPIRFSRRTSLNKPVFVVALAATLSLAVTAVTLVLPASRGKSLASYSFGSVMRETPRVSDDGVTSARFPYVDPHCGGAASAVFECPPTNSVTINPFDLDINPPSTETCVMNRGDKPFSCVIGDESASRKIAFVGDSHARTWWKAIDQIGERAHVAVNFFVRLGCGYRAGLTNKCGDHNAKVREALLAGDFELVVFTQAAQDDALGRYTDAFHDLQQHGLKIAVIADNFGVTNGERACVDYHFPDVNECPIGRTAALPKNEPAVSAARTLEIPVIDFSDIYCGETMCRPSIGGMLVLVDTGHMVTNFAATLAPFLWSELKSLGLI